MKAPVVVIGLGEMGQVFARGFLAAGHPVYPVLRDTDRDVTAMAVPEPALALVAVGEADLRPALDTLPVGWRARAGLLQNELLPRTWQDSGITDPTVAVVWFEKKPGRPVTVILPTPIFGPAASLVSEALAAVDIPAAIVPAEDELTFELVRKNLYILVANIAGLVTGGTVGELWAEHRPLALEVAGEVMAIQAALTGADLPEPRLLDGLEAAFSADPGHGATGRNAPARLGRARDHARALGIATPRLDAIAAGTAESASS